MKSSPYTALIDSGNTRMKVGWLNRDTGQRETTALAVEHQHVHDIATWFSQQDVRPQSAVGVNVAGHARAAAINIMFERAFGVQATWLGSQRQNLDIFNNYAHPEQLGADRWMSMVGLSQQASDTTTPLLLASFGTATTIDLLCPAALAVRHARRATAFPPAVRWVFDGGLIFPGPALMRASLATNTAQLPMASAPVTHFPDNTHQAISSGIVAAQTGAVLRQWQAALGHYGIAPRVYGTGGGWPAIEAEIQAQLAVAQTLNHTSLQPVQPLTSPILDGLARVAQARDICGPVPSSL